MDGSGDGGWTLEDLSGARVEHPAVARADELHRAWVELDGTSGVCADGTQRDEGVGGGVHNPGGAARGGVGDGQGLADGDGGGRADRDSGRCDTRAASGSADGGATGVVDDRTRGHRPAACRRHRRGRCPCLARRRRHHRVFGAPDRTADQGREARDQDGDEPDDTDGYPADDYSAPAKVFPLAMRYTRSQGTTGAGPASSFTGAVFVDTVRKPDEQSAIGRPLRSRRTHRLGPPPQGPDAVCHRRLRTRRHPHGRSARATSSTSNPAKSTGTAPPHRFMAHVAMQEAGQNGEVVTWLDHVTDEEYTAIPTHD